MSPPLFLLSPLPDEDAETLLLAGDEGHHAARVARVRVGETVVVGDGAGARLTCVVGAVGAGDVRLRILSRETVGLPSPRLVVVQALPKGERAELAVETMTELGVDVVVPWAASRSVTQWSGARGEKALARWRRTAQEAAKQSRRAWTPEVTELYSTAQVTALLRTATCGLVLHEEASSGLASVPLPEPGARTTSEHGDAESGGADAPAARIVLVVGPEGGVSPDELGAFTGAGATAVLLGSTVLRTSTAGPAALAALSIRLRRWT